MYLQMYYKCNYNVNYINISKYNVIINVNAKKIRVAESFYQNLKIAPRPDSVNFQLPGWDIWSKIPYI